MSLFLSPGMVMFWLIWNGLGSGEKLLMNMFCDRGIVDGLLIGLLRIDSHSDIHNINGELPMTTNVAGHEGIGRVVKGP